MVVLSRKNDAHSTLSSHICCSPFNGANSRTLPIRKMSRMAADLLGAQTYSTNSTTRTNQRKLHVGIIGAGVAGLRCADVLLEQGVQVTVLEARNRIGGRV